MKQEKITVNDKTYIIKAPTNKNQNDARMFMGGYFRKIGELETPPITRDSLPQYMEKIGLWDKSKVDELKSLASKIVEGERQLKRGGRKKDGSKFTKADGRKLSLDIKTWRYEQLNLMLQLRAYDHLTLEGLSENAQFDFLVSQCVFDENDKRVFANYEDYTSKADEDYAIACANKLAEIIYGSIDGLIEQEKKNPENQFLVNYGFARPEDLKLVDSEGNMVDKDGHRINEEGYRVNDQGEVVDSEGNTFTDLGEVAEEFTPFED